MVTVAYDVLPEVREETSLPLQSGASALVLLPRLMLVSDSALLPNFLPQWTFTSMSSYYQFEFPIIHSPFISSMDVWTVSTMWVSSPHSQQLSLTMFSRWLVIVSCG